MYGFNFCQCRWVKWWVDSYSQASRSPFISDQSPPPLITHRLSGVLVTNTVKLFSLSQSTICQRKRCFFCFDRTFLTFSVFNRLSQRVQSNAVLWQNIIFSGRDVKPMTVIAVIVTVFCNPKNVDTIISLHAYSDDATINLVLLKKNNF